MNGIISSSYQPYSLGNSISFKNFSGTLISSIDPNGNLQATGYVQGSNYVRAGNGTSAGIVDFWDLNSYKWRISTSGGFFTVLNDSTGTADTTGTGNPTNNKFFCDKNGVLTTVGGVKTNSINTYTGSDISINSKNLKSISNITKLLWSSQDSTQAPMLGTTPGFIPSPIASTTSYTRRNIAFRYNGESALNLSYLITCSASAGTNLLIGIYIVSPNGAYSTVGVLNTYTSSVTNYADIVTIPLPVTGLTVGMMCFVSLVDRTSANTLTYALICPEIYLTY